MTQEEKELLLKDLCGRLPYGIKFSWKGDKNYNIFTLEDIGSIMKYAIAEKGKILPYLRPMSSMTEDEKEYIKNRWCYEDWYDIKDFLNNYQIDAGDTFGFVDWLNAHHFDYRGLIPMGLALEAPKDMYNTKN